jgi:repressor LexA
MQRSAQEEFAWHAVDTFAPGANHGAMTKQPTTRVREWRKKRGLTLEQLSEASDISVSNISRLERGLIPYNEETLGKLARALGCAPGDLLPGDTSLNDPLPLSRVPVIGYVQAGKWREAMEWGVDERYSVPVPADPDHPKARRFGLEVRGTSMNRVFPEGTVVICIPTGDYNHGIGDGNFVVVQQRDRQTNEMEATVKQLQIDARGRAWLWPRSDDPEHQQPIELPRNHHEHAHHAGGAEIAVVAVVTKAVSDLVPRDAGRRLL